ncbi:predicted protein [Histoplasma mississippiense (nom. inval.)]|uniref:predicted protein n=1 Tax=Ajellomyces capsulatus (strain NAm1 / WU24) TaxID=2059318 RepID=UPI000157C762|nr:predicted protein [Histoplasma mississippiense (nom. inval.)]EDN08433.1 predicted protein [Histoplasma mississippiense (nom. inval.)]
MPNTREQFRHLTGRYSAPQHWCMIFKQDAPARFGIANGKSMDEQAEFQAPVLAWES